MRVRKIIIDTDPGIDDAMAIFLALASPELDVVGLTTVMGNVEVDLATTNALRLLEIAGRSDIPVAEGAGKPIATDFLGTVEFVHGDDGQGNAFLPSPASRPLGISAAEFIVQQARAYPGEITLVPIGPLTNIALALRLEPNLPKLVAGAVLMGGNAFCPGNASPTAEANIRNDPEALTEARAFWNAVPWRYAPAPLSAATCDAGACWLRLVLDELRDVHSVVVLGNDAFDVRQQVLPRPGVEWKRSPHLSRRGLNRRKGEPPAAESAARVRARNAFDWFTHRVA